MRSSPRISRTQGDAVPEVSLEETVASEALAPSHSGGSATTPQQMIEDLEEADFYFQQGLHEEAEEVYKRVLDAAPISPAGHAATSGRSKLPAASPRMLPRSRLRGRSRLDPGGGIRRDAAGHSRSPRSSSPDSKPAMRSPPRVEAEQQESGEGDFGMDLPDPSTLPDLDEAEDLDIDIDPPEERGRRGDARDPGGNRASGRSDAASGGRDDGIHRFRWRGD